jgi:heme/copper-type cytochrome/quinol oxidase subunit 2
MRVMMVRRVRRRSHHKQTSPRGAGRSWSVNTVNTINTIIIVIIAIIVIIIITEGVCALTLCRAPMLCYAVMLSNALLMCCALVSV